MAELSASITSGPSRSMRVVPTVPIKASSAMIVFVVILPPSIEVIVEPSTAKSPPVNVTSPEKLTEAIGSLPVTAVVNASPVVSMKIR